MGHGCGSQINAHDAKTPLFLYLAFTAPHSPYQAPKEYIDKYRHIEDPTRRTYAAMITCMDDEIGKVVAALEKKQMRENTLIVFMSDNGGNQTALLAGDATSRTSSSPPTTVPTVAEKACFTKGELASPPSRTGPGASSPAR